jgi:hypothetical protein
MPVGLTPDAYGNLWLTTPELALDETSRAAVAKLRRDGRLTRFAFALADPQGLAFDGRGNLFVADGRRGRVLRFQAPPAPRLNAPPPFTNHSPLTLSGTGGAGLRVDLFIDETNVATAPTDADGAFTLTVPLRLDEPNILSAVLTTHDGAGLSSASTDVPTVHDAIPPTVALVSPADAAFVRGVVIVRAQAADGGSGIAGLTLSADGVTLSTCSASGGTASASWDTSGGGDGARELLATATDRAGNANTARRRVIVDNTPPDTTIVSGPAGDVEVATATFVLGGSDALTPDAGLQFAWRLDGGPWSAFMADARVDLTGLSSGSHTFEAKARDLAGNEDPTPARRDFVVPGW